MILDEFNTIEQLAAALGSLGVPPLAINVKWFGATGDGTTDDLAAINLATTAAGQTTGAMIVEMPPGTYLVSDTVNIPNKVTLRGSGPIARTGAPGSTIKAKSGFLGSYVVQLGDDASNSVYCRLEDMGVDGDHIVNVGVYSNSINEESGLIRCTVTDCDTYCIHMDNSVTGLLRNFLLQDLYILNDTGASAAVFIHGGSSPQRGIDGLTVDNGGGNICLKIDACQGAVFERIHLENADDGIKIGGTTGCNACTFIGITGHSTLTDLIHIVDNSNSNLQFIGLYKNNATNVINDVQTGEIYTQNYIGMYATGDIISLGGNKIILDVWYQDNVAASQSAVALGRFGESGTWVPKGFHLPRAGSILGIAVTSNAARTAGTLTVEVFKNFSTATGLQAILGASNPQFKATYQRNGIDNFAAGDYIQPKITTDSAWAPTTADIRVMIEVEM